MKGGLSGCFLTKATDHRDTVRSMSQPTSECHTLLPHPCCPRASGPQRTFMGSHRYHTGTRYQGQDPLFPNQALGAPTTGPRACCPCLHSPAACSTPNHAAGILQGGVLPSFAPFKPLPRICPSPQSSTKPPLQWTTVLLRNLPCLYGSCSKISSCSRFLLT